MELNSRKKTYIKGETIPDRAIWSHHRLPRQLLRISEGNFDIYYWLVLFAMRRVANYNDLIMYYKKEYI